MQRCLALRHQALDRGDTLPRAFECGNEQVPRHQQTGGEAVGLHLVVVLGNELCARLVDAACVEDRLGVAGQEVVAQLVRHGKALKRFVVDVRRVGDGELVADPHQHARHARTTGGLCGNGYLELIGDGERIDVQVQPPTLDELLGNECAGCIGVGRCLHCLPAPPLALFARCVMSSSANRRSSCCKAS